jgi:hypothetical protein
MAADNENMRRNNMIEVFLMTLPVRQNAALLTPKEAEQLLDILFNYFWGDVRDFEVSGLPRNSIDEVKRFVNVIKHNPRNVFPKHLQGRAEMFFNPL